MSKINRRSFFEISALGGVAIGLAPRAFSLSTNKRSEPLARYEKSTYDFSHRELIKIAEKYGSPAYVYDWNMIKDKYLELSKAFKNNYPKVKVHYAYKANTNLNIVSLLTSLGAGAECISEGEMKIALECGQDPKNMILTSNSKSTKELSFAIEKGVLINIDSLSGLKKLIKIIDEKKVKTRISIRVNPDVTTTSTHKHISTGHKFTKFGLMYLNGDIYKACKLALDHKKIQLVGIHSHIGSQILELGPFEKNIKILSKVALEIKKQFNYEIKSINMGGGLGIPYRDGEKELSPKTLARQMGIQLKRKLKSFKRLPELWLEPGRYFVAQAGILLAEVNSVKMTDIRNFININTGFNHLARPVMYEAYHRVRILNKNSNIKKFQVAGNICETGDVLTQMRNLPMPEIGDKVAILDAGAYGFSMASEYNSFYLPAEIAIKDGKEFIIREREDFEDLLRNQKIIRKLV